MKIKSLKHNFIMYSVRMISGLLFTLLVFPYVARVLGPENLGKVQFTGSIIMYFILFINLGIPSYGKREVAFVRENREKMSILVLELLIILLLTTGIISLIYILSVNFIPYLEQYKALLYLYFIYIILNFMGVEWFYQGIENQEYITKRSILFKVISGIFIFILIKDRNDYLIYVGILIFSLMGSNILNFKKIFQYVSFDKEMLKKIRLKKHFNPILILFTTSLATTIFSNFDSVMVRTLVDERTLGYYSIANKLGRMPLMITTAVFTVFYPRLCNLINKKKYKEYYKLGNQGLDLSLIIAIPSTIGMFILAPDIIQLLAGSEFLEAISVFRIFSFLIPVMAFAFFSGQNLIANNQEKVFMKGQVIASVANIIFNFIFIPIFKASGAAVGTILAECIAISYRLISGREVFKNFSLIDKNKMKILFASIIMGVVIYLLSINLQSQLLLKLLILISIGIIIYTLNLIILKEKNMQDFIKKIVINRRS